LSFSGVVKCIAFNHVGQETCHTTSHVSVRIFYKQSNQIGVLKD
jgi:hypothetical protein